jgi:hypothetical protein
LIPLTEPVVTDDMSRGKAYFVGNCPNHKKRRCKPIFAVYQGLNDYIESRFPIPTFEASSLHKAIPEPIRQDYAEARRCVFVDAHKGAVVLLRRVVEATACDRLKADAKKANGDTKKLWELIDTMHEKGLITRDLRDSAHEIRHLGNYGAHVQDDGLDSVSREDANDVRQVTWQLLQSVYIGPHDTRELASKRQQRSSGKQ